MVAKKTEPEPEAVEEQVAEEDQPVPELRHPAAPGYVLREGQWVLDEAAAAEEEPKE